MQQQHQVEASKLLLQQIQGRDAAATDATAATDAGVTREIMLLIKY